MNFATETVLRVQARASLVGILVVASVSQVFGQPEGVPTSLADYVAAPVAAQRLDSVAGSVLARVDLPPDGVEALLNWPGGAGGGDGQECDVDQRSPARGLFVPTAWSDDQSEYDPNNLDPCVLGPLNKLELHVFPRRSRYESENDDFPGPASVRVYAPDGNLLWTTGDVDATYGWVVPLGSPDGDYQVVVERTGVSVSGVATVKNGFQRVTRVEPGGGLPGTTFYLLIAGFAPRQIVHAHLYRGVDVHYSDGSSFEFQSEWSVQTNANGDAILALPTLPTDPSDVYQVLTDPASARDIPLSGKWTWFSLWGPATDRSAQGDDQFFQFHP
jgi:hypothetical protein